MGSTTTFELREKDVVNVCNGQKLGRVTDLELDCDCGKVTAVIVTPNSLGAAVFSRCHVRIPWDKILKIGRDAVLVESPPPQRDKDSCADNCGERKWWKR